MLVPTDDDPNNSDFFKRVIDTAKELDALTTGALLSVLGGSVAIGMGYYNWILFAMSLPIVVYKVCWEIVERRDRLAKEALARHQQDIRDRIELIDKVKETLSSVENAERLDEEEKKFLIEKTKLLLEEQPPSKKRLVES